MLVGTVAAEALVSPELRDTDFVKQYMKPNVVIFSSAIYLFFIKRLSRIEYSEKTVKIFAFLTEMGFGVYCVHAIVNELMPGSLQVIRVICIYPCKSRCYIFYSEGSVYRQKDYLRSF